VAVIGVWEFDSSIIEQVRALIPDMAQGALLRRARPRSMLEQ
jgi:hypothetical protein